ncbi:MAG: hypothetical protein ACI9C4_002889 [Paraglaciecola sp.]|jgi:hypothetical protein
MPGLPLPEPTTATQATPEPTTPLIAIPGTTQTDKNGPAAGVGDTQAWFNVYIANRPDHLDYPQLSTVRALEVGDIERINRNCGNGWRKVFNVYGKLLFALQQSSPPGQVILPGLQAKDWQSYRDNNLLQANSHTRLLFSAPHLPTPGKSVHIVMGKTYAKSLNLAPSLIWLDQEFACDPPNRLIVCPYFDYRQLSDRKILHLVALIAEISGIRRN